MKKMDRDGLLLCKMQGNVFADSLKMAESSSEIFIRRFMNSDIVKEFDSSAILNDNQSNYDIFMAIEEEFGKTDFGKVKFDKDVLYWIGYIYRYMSYIYELSAKQVYKIIKPKELSILYPSHHGLDCEMAIDRIFDHKKVNFDEETKNQQLLKLIRKNAHQQEVDLTLMTKDLIYDFFKEYQNDPALFANPEDCEEYVYDKQNVDNYVSNIMSAQGILLAVMYKNQVIGEVVFWDLQGDECSIDILLKNDKYKNRGLGTVAIEKAMVFAEKELNVRKMNATMLKNNLRAIHTFKSLGFEYFGENDDYLKLERIL